MPPDPLKPENEDDVLKWLRLHLTKNVGSRTFAKLLKYFGDIDAVLQAGPNQLSCVSGISPKRARQIHNDLNQVDDEAELALAQKLSVKIITLQSLQYPPLLRQIHDPPHILYIRGEIIRSDKLAVAVVGSRSCSRYGQEQASRLSHLLAAAGFTVVSGLARGVDAAAHRGALAAKGRTIAVQGCGLATVFPPEHIELASQIRQSGAVVSELPLTFEPIGNNFPARNRIIAGMTLGTLVIESRRRSGAQITARLAMDYNREVLAVPGQIDSPGSSGPHQLIKDGAVLVENLEDIVSALGQVGNILHNHAAQSATDTKDQVEPTLFDDADFNLTAIERKIIDFLDNDPTHIDQIIRHTDYTPGQVNAAATSLQLKGLVKQLPGSFYHKR
ncbi:MAG: DNA-protecting protein DprA [Deltaproteobacteria bacterium]|nr:DNA-protecting protein DprA [Deltaproteobacteria bacterium]